MYIFITTTKLIHNIYNTTSLQQFSTGPMTKYYGITERASYNEAVKDLQLAFQTHGTVYTHTHSE